MRMTLDLDHSLLRQAIEATGTKSESEAIEMGLRALLEREARQRLKALYGSERDLNAVRRRP